MQVTLFTILGFMIGVALYATLRPSKRDASGNHEMGLWPTTFLGIAGSAAGCLASLHAVPYQLMGVQPAGLAASAVGACALVLLGDHVVAVKHGTAQPVKRALKQRA